jgi:hypothetical protein
VASRITNLGQEMSSKLTRQEESTEQVATREKSAVENKFEQVNAKIVALENRVLELPTRSAVAAEPRAVDHNVVSSSGANQSDLIRSNDTENNSVLTNENHTCSCASSSCNVCVSESINATRVHGTTEHIQMSSFLSTSDLPLRLFDDCSDTNSVFHLRRLDEFIRFKCVPKAL